MSQQFNLLAMSYQAGGQFLEDLRQAFEDYVEKKLDENTLCAVAVLDGAAEHIRYHPHRTFHHVEFATTCRSFFLQHGGRVLPTESSANVPDLACAWFPADGIEAVTAAVAIHQHFENKNKCEQPPWMFEHHAMIAIARTEYFAFRLLRMAVRELTLIAPDTWDQLPADFRNLAGICNCLAPDMKKQAEAVANQVHANGSAIANAYDRWCQEAFATVEENKNDAHSPEHQLVGA